MSALPADVAMAVGMASFFRASRIARPATDTPIFDELCREQRPHFLEDTK